MVAGLGIGLLEKQAKTDATFLLNKIPRPIVQLGYTGGTALALYALSLVAPGSLKRYARLGARAAAVAATYQMGKLGGAFADVTIAGVGDGEHGHQGEHLIDDHVMGALDSEGSAMSGNPYDDVVDHAIEHT
jgi:hypothetical protein